MKTSPSHLKSDLKSPAGDRKFINNIPSKVVEKTTDFFLSAEEIARFTGFKQKKKQVQQLIRMRIPHELDSWECPIVLRRAVENRLN